MNDAQTFSQHWAVLIGINQYHESIGPLKYCVNDANLLRNVLVSDVCSFPEQNMLLLSDDEVQDRQPTYGNIHSWLATWLSRPQENDLILVYFAGHGREMAGQGMLVPQDATLESLNVTGIPIQYVRDLLERCQAKQKVLILDACHSGAGRDTAVMTDSFRDELDAGEGIYTIASCDHEQISHDWPDKKHGVFTYYFVEAIRESKPTEPGGNVSLDVEYDYAYRKVIEWTKAHRIKQEPVRISRSKGAQIAIASRALSVEKRLAYAQAEALRLRATVAQREMECEEMHGQKARLADEITSLKQAIARAKETRRRAPLPEAEVPDWREWSWKRFPVNWENELFLIVLAYLFTFCVFFMAVAFAVLAFEGEWTGSVAVAKLSGFAVASLWPAIHVRSRIGLRNRYRLLCAKSCLKAGDYVSGAKYALETGTTGIRRQSAAVIVLGLARTALANEDADFARQLLKCARDTWRSKEAARELRDIFPDE